MSSPLNLADARDPANYETVIRNHQPCLVCRDCRREGRPGAASLLHARNCDLAGARNKTVGPRPEVSAEGAVAVAQVNQQVAAVYRGEAALHTDEIELQNLVRAGIVSMSAAMNQDF